MLSRLLLIASSIITCSSSSSSENPSECSVLQQQRILPTLLECEARDTIVRLHLPDNQTYAHVVPDHVTVKRCGASCNNRYHSCVPSSVTTRSFPVLVFPVTSAAAGATPSVCASALVEEHGDCVCACETGPDDCNSMQQFVLGECRCACANDGNRASCLSRGHYWNPSLCQCLCRDPATFPTCPSGYQFDTDECTCVTYYSEYASTMLEVLVLVVGATVLMAVYGLMQCHRHRLGPFHQVVEDEHKRSVGNRPNLTELRQIFRQISQQGPATLVGSSMRYEPISSSQEESTASIH